MKEKNGTLSCVYAVLVMLQMNKTHTSGVGKRKDFKKTVSDNFQFDSEFTLQPQLLRDFNISLNIIFPSFQGVRE